MPRNLSEPRVRQALALLALTQFVLGAVIAIAPGAFFNAIADYGTRNDHLLRDISTLYLALGIVLFLAVDRPSWRAPVLAFATLQYALHSINHLFDVGKADPTWLGPFNLLVLAGVSALLAFVWRDMVHRAR